MYKKLFTARCLQQYIDEADNAQCHVFILVIIGYQRIALDTSSVKNLSMIISRLL